MPPKKKSNSTATASTTAGGTAGGTAAAPAAENADEVRLRNLPDDQAKYLHLKDLEAAWSFNKLDEPRETMKCPWADDHRYFDLLCKSDRISLPMYKAQALAAAIADRVWELYVDAVKTKGGYLKLQGLFTRAHLIIGPLERISNEHTKARIRQKTCPAGKWIPALTITDFMDDVGVQKWFNAFYDQCLLVHQGWKDEFRTYVSYRENESKSTCQQDTLNIGYIIRHPRVWGCFVDPEIRFEHLLDLFPVTCCVDGTVIRTDARGEKVKAKKSWEERCAASKASGPEPEDGVADPEVADKDYYHENWSGKDKMYCYRFEVWVDLRGIPFHYRGPFPGSWSDTGIMNQLGATDFCLPGADATDDDLDSGAWPHWFYEYTLTDMGYPQGFIHRFSPIAATVTEENRNKCLLCYNGAANLAAITAKYHPEKEYRKRLEEDDHTLRLLREHATKDAREIKKHDIRTREWTYAQYCEELISHYRARNERYYGLQQKYGFVMDNRRKKDTTHAMFALVILLDHLLLHETYTKVPHPRLAEAAVALGSREIWTFPNPHYRDIALKVGSAQPDWWPGSKVGCPLVKPSQASEEVKEAFLCQCGFRTAGPSKQNPHYKKMEPHHVDAQKKMAGANKDLRLEACARAAQRAVLPLGLPSAHSGQTHSLVKTFNRDIAIPSVFGEPSVDALAEAVRSGKHVEQLVVQSGSLSPWGHKGFYFEHDRVLLEKVLTGKPTENPRTAGLFNPLDDEKDTGTGDDSAGRSKRGREDIK